MKELILIQPEVRDGRKSLYRCSCGKEKMMLRYNVNSGNSSSCGCEERGIGGYKHGGKGTPAYQSWKNMRARCNNVNHPRYMDWGGRGIKVCDRWDYFANFWADMGHKPDGHTLERVDNNGHYGPDNCVWASIKTQNSNQRPRKDRRQLSGVPLTEISIETGVPYSTLVSRQSKGWSEMEIIHGKKRS